MVEKESVHHHLQRLLCSLFMYIVLAALYSNLKFNMTFWGRPLLTFDFGLRSFEGGLRRSWLSEKLQATIWVFEKGFRCPSGQSTGLQKGLFLFLMLANELCNESDFVNVGARGQMFLQHVIFSLVLSLKTVKHRAHLEAKSEGKQKNIILLYQKWWFILFFPPKSNRISMHFWGLLYEGLLVHFSHFQWDF